ncbi:hypothetical protein BATDEDRAFT_33949 [Batrachochytrium dendrobatidis JAM81]|uniref:Chitin-binding type-1 domain-containing protein n=1 Tax=Batrachochytrium dendrobatidis (strain JAM81 / FGSC 10211) TaxID=684364 RepID=F4NSU2_BATDJ|nr:uncharacterized protein BATDEDRAFT_33949 [Batrachochytrium dendrobatidis JAM81]EGF83853.1 hypothetical protein BATDEDRAFT_33949 [Batrachochytrium dendrobatidis JAM81]|eukprot:XP_006675706.1 hypothetical protein BATDEDRAFT_33949 [Batrachochytrium dendrobatidis JAM81]
MVVIIHAVLIAALATVVFGQPGMSFTVSTNGRCGKKLGTTCPGNSCCSQNNMCGHSDSDCGDGCQIGYGLCSEIRSSITLSSKVTIYDGQCGPEFKIKCFKNRCCSKKGYCGLGSYYCQAGCKKGYGDCWGTNTPSILNSNFVYNPSNSCGPDVNIRCGDKKCCSIGGVCGSSNYHCGVGCQGRYGSCSKAGTSTDLISVLPKSNIKHPISKNNRCGKKFGTRCPGQKCCSGKGFCGKTPSHCGKNCQKDFGSCSKAGTSTDLISVLPKSNIKHPISKNNRCGKKFGTRCPGQKCCSGKGFCGKTPSHCGKNCQKSFGSCSKAKTVLKSKAEL